MPEISARSASQPIFGRLADFFKRTELTPNAALTLFVFAVVSMGGFMFAHSISIDDEVALSSQDYWGSFRQGRFLIGLLDLLVPRRVTPLYPYLFLAASYVVTYTGILYLHGLRHNWKTHLGFLIFILFPTNWLSQEFSVNVPGFAIGLLATTLAALQTQSRFNGLNRAPQGRLLQWRSLSPVVIGLMVIAIGGFQSLITLYLALSIGSLLFPQPLSSKDTAPLNTSRPSLAQCLAMIFSNAAVAIVVHTLILKLLLLASKSEVHQINLYYRSPYFMLRTQPTTYILGNIQQFLQTYLTPGVFYGLSLSGFTLLLIGAAYLYARSSLRHAPGEINHRLNLPQSALLALLLLLVPLSLNLISIPYRIPMRALMALPYIAWLASMLWLRLSEHQRSFTFLLGVTLSSLLIFQCVVTISGYYAARAMNQRADQLVASTIASSIIQSANNAKGGQPVSQLASFGALERKIPYATAGYSTAGASFFNWDSGNPGRMVAWLDAMGIHGIQAVKEKEMAQFKPFFSTMSAWPAPGSIQVRNNTVLVKLSNSAN